jgi:coenzyme F420 hydrogenase subunit beta
MPIPKISFEESLEKNVVLSGKCVGCNACVIVCPFSCLDYVEQKPKVIKECKVCGICPQVCPRYKLPWTTLEEFVFGRKSKAEEDFGVYQRLAIAQATDKNVLRVCQDGGVASALLTYSMKNGIIDGAAVCGVGEEKPLYPMPKLATGSKEVLASAGTRYFYSPNLLAFQEGVKKNKRCIAFVGTPCQIHAVRRIQAVPLKKYADKLGFTIGLMCTESFSYKGLFEKHIRGVLGISPFDIRKMNIKGKLIITLNNGENKEIPLTEAKQYATTSCVLCSDFSSELADISVGGLGLSNWTFTILRTKKGLEIFEDAEKAGVLKTRPVEEEQKAFDLLVRLSKMKRKRRVE